MELPTLAMTSYMVSNILLHNDWDYKEIVSFSILCPLKVRDLFEHKCCIVILWRLESPDHQGNYNSQWQQLFLDDFKYGLYYFCAN